MSDRIDYQNEQVLLSYILHNPQKINEFDEDHFISPVSEAIVKAVKQIKEEDLAFEFTTITSYARKHYDNVESSFAKDLYDNVTEFENIEKVKELQYDSYRKKKVLSRALEDLHVLSSKKGKLDVNKAITNLDTVRNIIGGETYNSKLFYTASELMDVHEEADKLRLNDKVPKSFGWSAVDAIIGKPFQPGEVTTIAAPPGMGKSIITLNVIERHLRRGTPILSFNTEMGDLPNGDRLIGIWGGMNTEEILKRNRTSQTQKEMNEIRNEIRKVPNLHYSGTESLYISDIDRAISLSKEQFMDTGVWNHENPYMIVTLDLFELLLDIPYKKQELLAKAMDDFFRVIKKHKINGMPFASGAIVTQIGENIFRDNNFRKQFKTMEDLDNFVFTSDQIFGSSIFTQRSRTVITLSRIIQLKKMFFPIESKVLDDKQDIILLNVAKNNHKDIGVVPLWFNKNTGKSAPIPKYFNKNTNEEEQQTRRIVKREYANN